MLIGDVTAPATLSAPATFQDPLVATLLRLGLADAARGRSVDTTEKRPLDAPASSRDGVVTESASCGDGAND